MLSKRQTSPPCRSTQLPSNRLTQAQGAQVAGQAASQHASPAAFPVASPCTNVAFSSSTCLTRSSLKAIAATFSDAIATTLPNTTDTNSTFGGLMLCRRFGENVPAWGPFIWPIIWEIWKGCTFALNNSVRRSISDISMSCFSQDMASDLRRGWWLWWRQDVLAR